MEEVTVLDPCLGFAGVSSTCPSPELFPGEAVDLFEGLLRHLILVIIGPSPDDRVELRNHLFLLRCSHPFDCLSDFSRVRLHILLGGFDEKLPVKFAQGLSEEVEPVGSSIVREDGVLLHEGETLPLVGRSSRLHQVEGLHDVIETPRQSMSGL